MAYSTERLIHNSYVYSGKGTLKDMRKLAIQIMKKEGYLRMGIVDLDKPNPSHLTTSKFLTVGTVEIEEGKYTYEDHTLKSPHVKISYLGADGSLKGIYFEHKGYEITENSHKYIREGRMPEKKQVDYLKAVAVLRKTTYLKVKNLTDNSIIYEGNFKNGKWYKVRK